MESHNYPDGLSVPLLAGSVVSKIGMMNLLSNFTGKEARTHFVKCLPGP